MYYEIPVALCYVEGGNQNFSRDCCQSFFTDDTASDLCIVFSLHNNNFISALPIQSRMSEELLPSFRPQLLLRISPMFAVRWQAQEVTCPNERVVVHGFRRCVAYVLTFMRLVVCTSNIAIPWYETKTKSWPIYFFAVTCRRAVYERIKDVFRCMLASHLIKTENRLINNLLMPMISSLSVWSTSRYKGSRNLYWPCVRHIFFSSFLDSLALTCVLEGFGYTTSS